MLINGVERNIQPYANWQGANLRHADLRHADLRHADLWGANLQIADLWGANLQGANLWGANLQSANLQGANLQGANLQGANLRGANLWSAKDIRNTQIFVAYIPGMSSRDDYLYGGLDDDFNLIYYAGCFTGNRADFDNAVNRKSKSERELYRFAADFIQLSYEYLVSSGVIERMRAKLNAETAEPE